MLLLTLITAFPARGDDIADAAGQAPPAVDIATGSEIPSEGYCDQPYVLKLADGTWLCTMTTGKGHEGQKGQHVVSCRSRDRGRSWGPLVDIEPADGPEASWVMPYLTEYGRVYVFYTYNAADKRSVIADDEYSRRRVDTLGEYAVKFSDDGGLTWSRKRWFIPVRETEVDRKNPYQGKVRFFWGVGKPIRHKGALFLGFSKVGRLGKGFIAVSESWFLRCANIETERDPAKLDWDTLPEGDIGLRSPEGAIAEEVNLASLSDGSLFCTYRTVAGHPCHAYSRDDGRTWSGPAFMTYRPGGNLVDHPRAANFVRRLAEGPYAGRYIYWFHNHGGTGYQGRNPAYLLGGVEHDGDGGKVIHWGEPVAVLFDRNGKVRISYPDFIWDDGLHITETQKTTARVHRIPGALLQSLWGEREKDAVSSSAAGCLGSFRPGKLWLDDEGVPINAHGGGFLFHDGAYYWFGQHMIEGKAGNQAHVGVRVYSSSDLYNWKNEGIALSVSDDPGSDITRGCILERPKVLHNAGTGKFVMWFHLELKGTEYMTARSGVAVADSVAGPYRFIESFRPDDCMARDMTLFKDDDGKAYHLYASEDNQTLHISLLTDDYLKPGGEYRRVFIGRYMEAPCLCKRRGKYYFLASGCTGWKPNAARAAVADSIFGPWMEIGNPCKGINPDNGLDEKKTFGCQSTFILPVQGKRDSFIAMFDMWRPRNAIDGRYAWLPVRFRGKGFEIEWSSEWDLSFFDSGR